MEHVSEIEKQELLDRVTVETRFWRKLLYTFNVITILASITLMAVGIYILNSTQVEMSAPRWAVQCLVAFGASLCVVSVVGLVGTYRSPEYIISEKCNFLMFFYQLMVLASFVVTLIAAVTFLTLLSVIDDVKKDNPQGSAKSLDDQIRKWAVSEAHGKWRDVQNYLGCCGYTAASGPNEPPKTGKMCPPNTGPPTLLASCCIIWTKPADSGAYLPADHH